MAGWLPRKPLSAHKARIPRVNLLIVDDEASLRDFLSIVFEEEGWIVEAAPSLADARAAIQRQEEARAALFAAGWKPTMANLPSVTEDHQYHKELVALNAANVAVTEKRAEMYRSRRRR